MKRLIAAILRPVLRWATTHGNRPSAIGFIVRDPEGAWSIIECTCGQQLGHKIELDTLRAEHAVKARAARDHLEGSPVLNPGEYQTY